MNKLIQRLLANMDDYPLLTANEIATVEGYLEEHRRPKRSFSRLISDAKYSQECDRFDEQIRFLKGVLKRSTSQYLTSADSTARNRTSVSNPYEWARQSEMVRATNKVLGDGELNPGVLSRACTAGKIETNGKPGRGARVNVTSFLAWVRQRFNIRKDEVDQVQNAVIGEIRSRNS